MTQSTEAVSKGVKIGIWVAQVIAAALFIMSGVIKLSMPMPDLIAMMPWAGEYSVTFVRSIGVIDLLGGLGLILPSLTRILPRLTVIVAVLCVILQILAIAFHSWRGEFAVLPTNAVYITFVFIVLWGRGFKAPISPRS